MSSKVIVIIRPYFEPSLSVQNAKISVKCSNCQI